MKIKKRGFMVLIEKDEDGMLLGRCLSLKGCHTQAKTLPVLIHRLKEAIQLCLEVERGPVTPLEFVGLEKIEVN